MFFSSVSDDMLGKVSFQKSFKYMCLLWLYISSATIAYQSECRISLLNEVGVFGSSLRVGGWRCWFVLCVFLTDLFECGGNDWALLIAAKAGVGLVPAHLECVFVLEAALGSRVGELIELPFIGLLLEILSLCWGVLRVELHVWVVGSHCFWFVCFWACVTVCLIDFLL